MDADENTSGKSLSIGMHVRVCRSYGLESDPLVMQKRFEKMRFARLFIHGVRLGLVISVVLGLSISPLEAGDGEKASPLLQPKSADMTQTAPATFKVKFATSEGDFVVESQREWAPRGVDRFYNLVKNGYYDGVCFFRVISGFMAQFGIHGDPKVAAAWRPERLQDDPVKQSEQTRLYLLRHGGAKYPHHATLHQL